MAETQDYVPTVWEDEVPGETPVTYDIEGLTAGLTIAPHVAPTPGTPVNATNLNKMEAAILAATPAIGSYTPTVGGFVTPTIGGDGTFHYLRFGELCIIFVESIGGTSNDEGFAFSLPFQALTRPGAGICSWSVVVPVSDNGVSGLLGIASAGEGDSECILGLADQSNWTPSGIKGVAGFVFIYACDPASPVA